MSKETKDKRCMRYASDDGLVVVVIVVVVIVLVVAASVIGGCNKILRMRL